MQEIDQLISSVEIEFELNESFQTKYFYFFQTIQRELRFIPSIVKYLKKVENKLIYPLEFFSNFNEICRNIKKRINFEKGIEMEINYNENVINVFIRKISNGFIINREIISMNQQLNQSIN